MARLVLDGEERQLRNSFKMRQWFARDEDRRERYFAQVRNIIEDLLLTDDEGDPPDRTVQRMLAIMIERDKSFSDHVVDQNIAERPWKEIWLACAGMILEAYIRATEA